MKDVLVTLQDTEDRQVSDAIGAALGRYNGELTGIRDRKPLMVVLRDPENKAVIGGLTGRTSLGLLFIDAFFVPDHLRQSGLGSRVLKPAEAEAVQCGCCAAVLYTISFQAPKFYKRHGYRVFGEIACHPPGASRIYMTKH